MCPLIEEHDDEIVDDKYFQNMIDKSPPTIVQ